MWCFPFTPMMPAVIEFSLYILVSDLYRYLYKSIETIENTRLLDISLIWP